MRRRDFMSMAAAMALLREPGRAQQRIIHQATGLKVGEVSPESAIVWMRLTKEAERKRDGIVRRGRPQPYPDNLAVESLEGSTPGLAGQIRLQIGRAHV